MTASKAELLTALFEIVYKLLYGFLVSHKVA